jgi:4-amino-4-deoxy-L-arabinose transferase-like glycosyltransferase
MATLEPVTADLLLGGKIISLLAGIATIPIAYLLWEKIESEKVALLASWLLAVNITAWYHSMHVFRDSLFLFLTTSSFFCFFTPKRTAGGCLLWRLCLVWLH